MPTIRVDGDLDTRLDQFLFVMTDGTLRDTVFGLVFRSSTTGGVTVDGTDLEIMQSGPHFIEGTVESFELAEFVGGDPNNIARPLTISGLSEDATRLFFLIERTETTNVGAFDTQVFQSVLQNNDWTILGGDGDDILMPTPILTLSGSDWVQGGAGNDSLEAGAGDDTLTGGDGNDTIADSDGNDSLSGGAGEDLLVLDGTGGADTFDGGDSTDTLRSDFTGIAADSFVLEINLAAGTITGSGGLGPGSDTIMNVENVEAVGPLADILIGDDQNNRLLADEGDDLLQGGAGADTLLGGPGDDTLDGGGGADEINGGDGYDIASYASADRSVRVDLQIPAISFNDAAGDTFISIEEFQTGDGIDQLRGDAGDNIFRTGGVSDRLYGRAGDDMLFGEAGADAFYGGLGADIMTGGDDAGRRDRYIYFNAAESGVGDGNRDVITDFVAGEDRIELSRIDADITQGFKQGFDFIGDAAFTGTGGELRYEQVGGNTIVQADRDGDGVADFEIELTGIMDLTESDFLI